MSFDDLVEQLIAAFAAERAASTIELGRRVVAEQPDLVPALKMKCSALASLSRHDEARAVFAHALRVAPPEEHIRRYEELGHVSLEQGAGYRLGEAASEHARRPPGLRGLTRWTKFLFQLDSRSHGP